MMGNFSKMVGNRRYQGFISQPRQEMLACTARFQQCYGPSACTNTRAPFLQSHVLFQVCCSYFNIIMVLGYLYTLNRGTSYCLEGCRSLDQEEPQLAQIKRKVQYPEIPRFDHNKRQELMSLQFGDLRKECSHCAHMWSVWI